MAKHRKQGAKAGKQNNAAVLAAAAAAGASTAKGGANNGLGRCAAGTRRYPRQLSVAGWSDYEPQPEARTG